MDDFLAWLSELETAELRKFVDAPGVDPATQRGIVQGIRLVRQSARLNSLEDAARARHAAARDA
jgi:hypothetical protein